jgi:hypothetical protein
MPKAKSLGQGCVIARSRSSASRATSASPFRVAASISSGRIHFGNHGSNVSVMAFCAADIASS